MSNASYVNIIKVALFKVTSDPFFKVANDLSMYVGGSLSVLVMAVKQSDGLEIEAVFLFFLPVTSGVVGVPEAR
jgi:hypothetical protein